MEFIVKNLPTKKKSVASPVNLLHSKGRNNTNSTQILPKKKKSKEVATLSNSLSDKSRFRHYKKTKLGQPGGSVV